ncbi:MAG: AraC family transcriptional regulator [Verrucomicrobia bacterium]|nr:AraC family transcriptional regulator [Verrucomicrobiota bacterium]
MTQGRIIGRGGGEFPEGYWQSFRWMPHPELAMLVRGYNGYFESSSRPVRRRELPSGEVALIISLGPQWRLIDPATGVSAGTLRTFVAGLDDTYSLVESEISGGAIQVDFTPIGARQLLQLPMHLVSKRTTELTNLLGSQADRLVEQLAEAPSWHSRFLTLDNFLLSRIRRYRRSTSEIDWAWRQLDLSRGSVRVQKISEQLGWTRKRLVKAFRDEIGIPPKVLARVLRFRKALAEFNAQTIVDFSQLAADSGYSDQAHMIRDFKDFSGLTPAELIRVYSPEAGTIES